jgi:hypothetical protein
MNWNEGPRQPCYNRVLHLQKIGPIRIELIRPEMCAGLSVNELGRYAAPWVPLLRRRQYITDNGFLGPLDVRFGVIRYQLGLPAQCPPFPPNSDIARRGRHFTQKRKAAGVLPQAAQV